MIGAKNFYFENKEKTFNISFEIKKQMPMFTLSNKE